MKETLKPVAALLISVAILLTGQGLQGTLLPIRATMETFSTISIGGFSTHDASFAYFEQTSLRWTAVVFMVISGINFALHYIAWTKKRALHYFYDSEVKLYLSILVTTGLITYITLYVSAEINENILADSIFQAVSIGTTTGYLTSNYSNWPLFVPIMLLTAAFIGCLLYTSPSPRD